MLQLGGPHHLGECSFSKWKPINCSLTYERNRVYVERKMLCLTFFRIRQISRVIEFYTQLQLRSTQSNVTHWVRPVNIYCGKKCLMHIFWRTHESVYRFFVDWKTFSFFSFIHLNADLSNHFFRIPNSLGFPSNFGIFLKAFHSVSIITVITFTRANFGL